MKSMKSQYLSNTYYLQKILIDKGAKALSMPFRHRLLARRDEVQARFMIGNREGQAPFKS